MKQASWGEDAFSLQEVAIWPVKTYLLLSGGQLSLEPPGRVGRQEGSVHFYRHFDSLGSLQTISKVTSQATLAPAPTALASPIL